MTGTSEEMTRLAAADELQRAARRRDGTPHDPVAISVIRHGDDVPSRALPRAPRRYDS